MARHSNLGRFAIALVCAAAFVLGPGSACFAVQPQNIYQNSFALLIGINEYPKLPKANWLSYSVNDVKAMQKLLVGSYGFSKDNIKILTDEQATKANIEQALSDFADSDRIKNEDRVLIYFSGHGQTVRTAVGGEMGFLIPYDAQIKLTDIGNAGPFMSTCLPMSRVWEYLQPCPAKHVLILADVCYSGMLAQSRALEEVSEAAVEVLAKTPARQVITAGGKGQKSFENSQWGHGAFTYKLLEKLNARTAQPGKVFTAQELFAEVQKGVGNITQGKQTPQMYNKETEGEFLFVPVGESSSAPSGNLTTTPARSEGTPETGGAEEVSTTGKIKVTSTPPGATVILEEEEVEGKVTPCVIECNLGASKSKKVEVALKLNGYKDAVYQVTAVRGKQVTVDGKLTVKPAKPAKPAPKPATKPAKPSTKPSGSSGSGAKPANPAKPAADGVPADWVKEDFEGLKFAHPKDWSYKKLGDGFTPGAQFAIVGPLTNGFAPNMNVVIEMVGSMSTADYAKLSESSASSIMSDFKVVSRADVNVNGKPSKALVYTASPTGTQLKFKCVMQVISEIAVIITFTALPSQYDDSVKVFDTFLKSIKGDEDVDGEVRVEDAASYGEWDVNTTSESGMEKGSSDYDSSVAPVEMK